MAAHGAPSLYETELTACPNDQIAAPPSGTVLYSNDEGRNRPRAEAFAELQTAANHPARTLEQTPYGGRLDAEKLFDDPEVSNTAAQRIWRDTSVKFTNQASGNVNTFVVGATRHSIFRNAELPTALANPDVSSINGVSREDLSKLHRKDSEAAFNKICEAELVRDRQRSITDPALAQEVAARENLYRTQVASQGRTAEQATEIRSEASRAEARWSAKATQKHLGEQPEDDLQTNRSRSRAMPLNSSERF